MAKILFDPVGRVFTKPNYQAASFSPKISFSELSGIERAKGTTPAIRYLHFNTFVIERTLGELRIILKF